MTREMIADILKMLAGWLMINVPAWMESASIWFTFISTVTGALVMVVTYKRVRIKLKITQLELKEKERRNEADK